MEQIITKSSIKEKFIAISDAFLAADEKSRSGKAAMLELDFPTTRHEDWRYTRTGRISNEEWKIVDGEIALDLKPFLIPGLDADLIVIINGKFRKDLSTSFPENKIGFNTEAQPSFRNGKYDSIFQAFADAVCTSTLDIRFPKNYTGNPIHILHIITEEKCLAQPHIEITAARSSNVYIVESFAVAHDVKSFTNRTLNISVEENAQIHLDKIQLESDENFLLNEENISVRNDARFTINTLTIDGGWVRNNLNIALEGQNSEVHLNGIYLPRKKQHVDNHTKVDHQLPHCNSNELYKGLINDQASGVFNGKVYVRPDAQKTNAFQSNANILLSDDAQMNTKPELEIYADDVKCSHGTTTGQMDDNALFYLKSRGLGEENARKLLSTAFIHDVMSKVEKTHVRDYVNEELSRRELLFIS